MTKCIVLGEALSKEKTPITFSSILTYGKFHDATDQRYPKDFEYLELIAKGYTNDTIEPDIIFAYNDPKKRNEGYLFLGKWNDGVV